MYTVKSKFPVTSEEYQSADPDKVNDSVPSVILQNITWVNAKHMLKWPLIGGEQGGQACEVEVEQGAREELKTKVELETMV